MNKKCVIMRGLPGSGKTRWAMSNHLFAFVCSTDLFFTDENGVYRFDPTKLAENHNLCLKRFVDILSNGSPVVVDNTNVRCFEIAPYCRLAEAFGYEVEIVHVLADPAVCVARNTHGVPEATIRTMAASFDPLPPWWNVRYVVSQ